MKFKNFAEREMTKKEKAKEKRLKKKYDDSDMKKDMKDRYGEDWKEVYYATIRKKAMEQFTVEAMQSFPYKIYNDDEMLIADDLESALEILDGEVSEQDLEQIEDMAMSGDVVPLLDTLDGFGYKVELEEKKSLASLRNRSSFDAVNRQLNKQKRRDTAKIELPKPRQLDLFNSVQKEGMMDDEVKAILMKYPEELAKLKSSEDLMDVYDTPLYQELFSYYADSGEMPYDTMKARDGDPVQFIQDELDDMGVFEGYKVLPNIDKERYTEMPGLEGPFQTMSGKPIYYDPKEGSYYDRDTDMYLTYAEFKALDDPKPSTGRMKEDEGPEDDEYDPRRVKANVMKHLVDMYNDAKKDNGYSSEKMDFALGNLLHDMDMAGYMNSDYFDIEGFFHKGIDKKQDYKVNMGMLKKAYAQAKNLPDDTTVEGYSPHKKGTKKYKAHMAAMHANSVDLNSMRDALKLDESTDANTVIAEYTRATLDQRHDTWGKVCEQIDFIRSFVKDDIDIKNVQMQIKKMHEREKLDRNIALSENIDKLRKIVADKSAMPIKFADGSMKIDMTTANIFVQMYDKMKERNQQKIDNMMQTKAGFLKVLDFFYGAMK